MNLSHAVGRFSVARHLFGGRKIQEQNELGNLCCLSQTERSQAHHVWVDSLVASVSMHRPIATIHTRLAETPPLGTRLHSDKNAPTGEQGRLLDQRPPNRCRMLCQRLAQPESGRWLLLRVQLDIGSLTLCDADECRPTHDPYGGAGTTA